MKIRTLIHIDIQSHGQSIAWRWIVVIKWKKKLHGTACRIFRDTKSNTRREFTQIRLRACEWMIRDHF